MDTDSISVTHAGVEIIYSEDTNKWLFTLRGRARSTDSLTAAREAIDKPQPKKKNDFQPVACWMLPQWQDSDCRQVTVTSVAEPSKFSSSEEVWIVTEDKSRSKIKADRLYPVGKHNDPLIFKYNDLARQLSAINDQLSETKDQLQFLTIPKEVE